MKINILLLSTVLLFGFLYMLYVDAIKTHPNIINQSETSIKDIDAPDFSFTDIEGKIHSLSDYRGKYVILNFWASWCAPCVEEIPEMIKFSQHRGRKSILIFLSLDENPADIDRFLKKRVPQLPLPNVIIGLDTDKKISQSLFQTYKIPETFLIDRNGIIKEKIIGYYDSWNGPETSSKINDPIDAMQLERGP